MAKSSSAGDYEDPSSMEEGIPLLPKSEKRNASTEQGEQDSSSMEEGIPLLPKSETLYSAELAHDAGAPLSDTSPRKSFRETASNVMASVSAATLQTPTYQTSHHNKLLCYDQDSLLTSRALLYLGSSVFGQKPVLYTLLYCSCLAGIAAAGVFYIPKASKLDTQKFDDFSKFLQVFISFMLGIYVQQAFKRWWESVSTFEKILINIRQLVFMLHTIKVTPTARKRIEGYCIASSYVLNIEVRNAQMIDKRNHVDLRGVYTWLVSQSMLSEGEIAQLQKSCYSLLSNTRAIWSFIGCCCSQPQVEEGVSVMPPLLVRTIMMCQACISEIEKLKMNITMQTPFMYSQLLAILVHVNNTILAVSCGMSLGSALHEIRRRSEQLSGGEHHTEHRDMRIIGELYEAAQEIGVKLLIVLLSPMIYIAFLHIAHILCYPFGDESYHLPTETLIARLHAELNHMNDNREYFRHEHKDLFPHQPAHHGGKDSKGKHDEVDDGDDADGD